MQSTDRWNTQHGHTENEQLTALSPPSHQQLSLGRGKASLPRSPLEGTTGAITVAAETHQGGSVLRSAQHLLPSDPVQLPAPATSLPFVKLSCPQPNPLTLSLSHYSIFKLMPGQAWDRRKLTLRRGSSLHNASYRCKHCFLPFSHSAPDLPQSLRVSLEHRLSAPISLCWWAGKCPLQTALYLGGCKVFRTDNQLCLDLHQKQPSGNSLEPFQSCLQPCWDTSGSPVLEQEVRRDLAAGGKHL